MTVAELKALLADWPETDSDGEPTEVWLTTGPNRSSQCVMATQLNMREQPDGTWAYDLLLEPDETAWPATGDPGRN